MIELYEDRSIIKEVKTDKLTNFYSFEFFKKFCAQFDEAQPNILKDMVSINITRFRLLNELYGKDYSDEVLKNIARFLEEFVDKGKRFCFSHKWW